MGWRQRACPSQQGSAGWRRSHASRFIRGPAQRRASWRWIRCLPGNGGPAPWGHSPLGRVGTRRNRQGRREPGQGSIQGSCLGGAWTSRTLVLPPVKWGLFREGSESWGSAKAWGLVPAQQSRGAVIVIVAAIAVCVLQLMPTLAGCGVRGLCFGACHGLLASLAWGMDDVLEVMGWCQGLRPNVCKAQTRCEWRPWVGRVRKLQRGWASISRRTESYVSPRRTECREGMREPAEGRTRLTLRSWAVLRLSFA